MEDNKKAGGISFFGLLTIVFITLKLMGVIGWSWFWVLSPLIIPIGITLIIMLVLFIATIIIALGSDD